MSYCKKCGEQIEAGMKFCKICGEPAIVEPIPKPPSYASPAAPGAASQTSPSGTYQQQQYKQPQYNQQQYNQPIQQIQQPTLVKAKIGISLGLLGAALYFMGIISIVPQVLLAGYVLLFEENAWLKKAAVRSVMIVISFSILSAAVGLLGNSQSILIDLIGLFKGTIDLTWLTRIISMCRTAIAFAQTIILIVLGVSALSQSHGDIKFAPVDNIVSKHVEG